MTRYRVRIWETVAYEVTVDAETPAAAEAKGVERLEQEGEAAAESLAVIARDAVEAQEI